MEVKEWLLETGHYFSHTFFVEEDSEDGSNAPYTSYFLQSREEDYGHAHVPGR